MNRMDDDQLDAALRRFLVAESEVVASRAVSEFEMVDRLNVVARRPWDRRIIVLLAAALLLAAAAGAAIVGSGLIRETPQVDHAVPRLLGAAICPSGFADEVVMSVTMGTGNEATPYSEITLYRDGELLSKPATGTPTVRWLSPSGIERVVERASAVQVDGNCRSVPAARPYGSMYVETSDGFFAVSWGSDPGTQLHPTTPSEKAAVEELDNWLAGLDEWLTGSDLIDATPDPYVADRWSVRIQRVCCGHSDPAAPDAADFTFPDGSTLTTFGIALPISDPSDPSATSERCGLVAGSIGQEIKASLDATGLQNADYSGWLFTEGGESGPDIVVQLAALDPHSRGCLDVLDQPPPVPSASPDPLSEADPCSILTDEQVTDALGRSVSGEAHLSGLPGGMRDCVYFAGASNAYMVVSIRQLTTSVEDGRELARELFGTDLSETVQGDDRVYTNRCADAPLPCDAAIAISHAPYFVVLSSAVPWEATPDQALRLLSPIAIESLATP